VQVPKINVYLPEDMAAEVREAKLSVSPVCQQAIRKELDRLNAQREATRDIDAVAARLRGTINEEEAVDAKNGYADGTDWARNFATASELREFTGLEDLDQGGDLQRGGILPDHSILDFMSSKDGENVFSVSIEENPYWRGFVDGASKVLEQVEPLL